MPNRGLSFTAKALLKHPIKKGKNKSHDERDNSLHRSDDLRAIHERLDLLMEKMSIPSSGLDDYQVSQVSRIWRDSHACKTEIFANVTDLA